MSAPDYSQDSQSQQQCPQRSAHQQPHDGAVHMLLLTPGASVEGGLAGGTSGVE